MRAPLGRSLAQLERAERVVHHDDRNGLVVLVMSLVALTHLPFVVFARHFALLTRDIAHAQERRADAFAAQLAGQSAPGTALRRIASFGWSFQAYWQRDVAPLLAHGVQPPLMEGYRAFLSAPDSVEQATRRWEEARRDTQGSFSHPAVARRLADATPTQDSEEGASHHLLGAAFDVSDATYHLLLPAKKKVAFQAVTWSEVGNVVCRAAWRERLAEHADALQGVGVLDLARTGRHLNVFLVQARLVDPYEGVSGTDRARGVHLLSAALGEALASVGWVVMYEPGRPVRLERSEERVEPEELVWSFVRGKVDDAAWERWCDTHGLVQTRQTA